MKLEVKQALLVFNRYLSSPQPITLSTNLSGTNQTSTQATCYTFPNSISDSSSPSIVDEYVEYRFMQIFLISMRSAEKLIHILKKSCIHNAIFRVLALNCRRNLVALISNVSVLENVKFLLIELYVFQMV